MPAGLCCRGDVVNRVVNWYGFSAGVLTIVVLAVSLFIPWWQLTVGDNLIKVNASPVNTNFGLFGTNFTLPLLWALNLVSVLTFSTSGIIMLFYSLYPTKPYAKQLLGFSYKKPLFSLVTFLSSLLVITSAASLLNINVPIVGSTTMNLPASLAMGASINAAVSGGFQLPFWLAIATAALCIIARLQHKQVIKETPKQQPPPP
jgi:hypothetical protein